ncbi:hypothetical protein M422DRAFT_53631 [Sphaerobolus stellatus SS14]|uniref:C2H2-type domain-containing protein n=1 Tax=Sphaerobolus stellatus (strain SS14) TaxID=990650 RepID=A0A0C9UZX0_SPHS4|nr:hypothetical protein M422DRAFT_53631 [Sphaerobolus stellatus SS14]
MNNRTGRAEGSAGSSSYYNGRDQYPSPTPSSYLCDEGLAATAAAYSNLPSQVMALAQWMRAHLERRSGSVTHSPTSDTYFGESEDGSGQQHSWVQVGNVTTTKHLSHLVLEESTSSSGALGFPHKAQLVTHIRSVHLQEKPFLCITCKTPFARKQDAVRHVATANSGTRYPCGLCSKTFARKSYRDSHQDLCIQRSMITSYNRTQANNYQGNSYPQFRQ